MYEYNVFLLNKAEYKGPFASYANLKLTRKIKTNKKFLSPSALVMITREEERAYMHVTWNSIAIYSTVTGIRGGGEKRIFKTFLKSHPQVLLFQGEDEELSFFFFFLFRNMYSPLPYYH